MSKCFFSLFLLLCSSCSQERISVQSDYLSIERLASYYVETPDPMKCSPDLGQRLIISWSLPGYYLSYEDLHLELTVRLRTRCEETISVPVCCSSGSYFYYLLNDDYFDSGGILTYKVDLFGDGVLLEQWRHQIWADLICFDE